MTEVVRSFTSFRMTGCYSEAAGRRIPRLWSDDTRIIQPLLNCVKSLLQVCKYIVDMLGSDGETDGSLGDTLIQQLFLGKLGMGGGCRMDHQTLHICHICQQGENAQIIDKLPCCVLAALDLEGEDGCSAVREILLIQCVIRMIRKRRMIYLGYLRMVGKEFHNLLCVLCVTLQTKGQCLYALQKQKCAEGSNGSAGITKEDRTDIGNKCCGACYISEGYAG